MSEKCLVCQDPVTDPATAISMQEFSLNSRTHNIHKWCFFCTKCFLPLNLENAVVSDRQELLCLDDHIGGNILPDCAYCGSNCNSGEKVEDNGFHFHGECYNKMMQMPYQPTASVLEHQADYGMLTDIGSTETDADEALADLQALFETETYQDTPSPEEILTQEQQVEEKSIAKASAQEDCQPQIKDVFQLDSLPDIQSAIKNVEPVPDLKTLYDEFQQEQKPVYTELQAFQSNFFQNYTSQNDVVQEMFNQGNFYQQPNETCQTYQHQSQNKVHQTRNDFFQQPQYKNRELYRLVQTDRPGVFQLAKIDPNVPLTQTIQNHLNQSIKREPQNYGPVEQKAKLEVVPMKRQRSQSPDSSRPQKIKFEVVPMAGQKSGSPDTYQHHQEVKFRASPAQKSKSVSSSSESSNQSGSSWGRKNHRMSISVDQKAVLQESFNISPFPNRNTRIDLGQKVGLDQRQVQIWFQNTRSKEKKFRKRKIENVDPSYFSY